MKKKKLFDFLNKILYSSLFLWVLLLFLKGFNLKPDLKASFFFLLPLLLFLILFLREALFFLILALNKINTYFDSSKKLVEEQLPKTTRLIFVLFVQFFRFLRKLPLVLKIILTNYLFWLILAIFGIFLDIFVFKFTSDLLILILAGLWVLSVYHYKFEGKASVGLALGFLILCPLLLIFKKESIAEKVAIWAYMFLVVGVVQLFVEYLKEERKSAEKER